MRVAVGAWRRVLEILVMVPLSVVLIPAMATGLKLLCVGILVFYRDPERFPRAAGIVSPADGRVTIISDDENRIRLGIFMSVFDVHVNRSPVSGRITECVHTPGNHRPAFTKSADSNECVRFEIDTKAGPLTLQLIAGSVARRITPYAGMGEFVCRGERIGHIAFGSRVDLTLPPSITASELEVSVGDRVRAGETVLCAGAETPPGG